MSGIAGNIESFDDNEVIELEDSPSSVTQDDIKEDPTKDTFDNSVYTEEVDKDSNVAMLDNKEGDQDVEKKGEVEEKNEKEKGNGHSDDGKEKKKEGEAEGKADGEQKEEGGKDQDKKADVKTIKIKSEDGKDFEVPLNATVKTKVKGKNEFVTIEELKSSYSGQKAWTEEIETAKQKASDADFKVQKLNEEKQEIAGHLEKIAAMLDKEDGDPLAALYYLVDFTGRDVNNYSKRVFDFMENQVQGLSEMDEVERELYWKKKELDAVNNNQAAKAEETREREAQRDLESRINRLRESQGISEQQFVEAFNELVHLGLKAEQIKPEQAIEYAVLKPFAEKAEAITHQFNEDLGDDDLDSLTAEITNVLRRNPEKSAEDALEIAAKILGFEIESVDDHIDNLNDKIIDDTTPSPSDELKVKPKKEDEIESFDDFDDF